MVESLTIGQRVAKRPRLNRRRRVGLTLIETLLSVFLISTLVVLIGAAINFYVRFVDVRRTSVAEAQVGRAVLRRIAEDVRGGFYPPADDSADSSGAAGGATGSGTGAGGTGDAAGGTTDGTGSTGDSTFDSSDDTSTVSATENIAGTAVQSSPGLYGNQYELQVDVSRDPRPDQYDALVAAGIDPRVVNIGADLTTISYYMRPLGAGETAEASALSSSAGSSGNVLIRRVVNRAEALLSTVLGDTGALSQGEQVLADDVLSIEFLYFDGLEWWTDWDSGLQGGLPMAVSITVVVASGEARTDSQSGSTDAIGGATYQLTVHLPTAEPTFEDLTESGI